MIRAALALLSAVAVGYVAGWVAAWAIVAQRDQDDWDTHVARSLNLWEDDR
jgi:hypothetical protein